MIQLLAQVSSTLDVSTGATLTYGTPDLTWTLNNNAINIVGLIFILAVLTIFVTTVLYVTARANIRKFGKEVVTQTPADTVIQPMNNQQLWLSRFLRWGAVVIAFIASRLANYEEIFANNIIGLDASSSSVAHYDSLVRSEDQQVLLGFIMLCVGIILYVVGTTIRYRQYRRQRQLAVSAPLIVRLRLQTHDFGNILLSAGLQLLNVIVIYLSLGLVHR